jgi:2-methylcitrate dehydratase
MPCRLIVHLKDGRSLTKEKADYEGFHSKPATWEMVQKKFEQLSDPHASSRLQGEVVGRVAEIEKIRVQDLLRLLSKVGKPAA